MSDAELTIKAVQDLIKDNTEMIVKLKNLAYVSETDIINTLDCNITYLIMLQSVISLTEVK